MENGSVNLGHHSSGPGRAMYDSTGTADVKVEELVVYSNVVIVEMEREEVSKGGIVIPNSGDAQKVRWGIVRGVGPGRYEEGIFVPTHTKVGDRVMFGKYQSGGEPIKMNGKEYLLFHEGDLIARVDRNRA